MVAKRGSVGDVILALAAYRDGNLHPCGTAFFIGQHLALTASHVIEKPFDQRRDFRDSQFGIVALERVGQAQDARCWHVESAHFFPVPSEDDTDPRALDICVLKLSPIISEVWTEPKPRNWHVALNVAPPAAGEDVTAYGFSESKANATSDPDLFLYGSEQLTVKGRVQQTFFPRRDRGFLPFPSFEISADFEAGMSGGPIFNGRNQVCGIVTSGGIAGVSYGSVLWPILGVEIRGGMRLFDMATQGSIRAVNHHCVEVNDTGARFPGLSFDPNKVINS
jgi:hypothetical protein